MLDKGSLKDKFDGYGSQPSEGLWDNIAGSLDAKKRKRGIIIWWTFGSGIAASLIIIFSVFNSSTDPVETKMAEHSEVKVETPAQLDQTNNIKHIEPENNMAQNESTQPIDNDNIDKAPAPNNNPGNPSNSNKTKSTNPSNTTPSPKTDNNPVPNKIVEPVPLLVTNDNDTDLEITEMSESETPLLAQHIAASPSLLPVGKNKDIRKWDIGFDAQQNFTRNASYQTSSQLGAFASQWQGNAELLADGNVVQGINESYNLNQITYIKTTRPLNLKGHVAYHLNRFVSIQSGVDLGWIRTQSRYGNNATAIIKSNIITVGAPITFNFRLWRIKRFDLGCKIGALNDFIIINHDSPSGDNLSFLPSNQEKKLSYGKGFIGGLESGINIGFALNDNLGLVLSPSVKWFYSQNIQVPAPLIQNPFFVTSSVGLKWIL